MTAYVYGATRRQHDPAPVQAAMGRVARVALAERIPVDKAQVRALAAAALPPTPQPNPAPVQGRPKLTAREVQVLRCAANGLSNDEIGRELWLSADTVKTHLQKLKRKLGARDRTHAVALGFRDGLLRTEDVQGGAS